MPASVGFRAYQLSVYKKNGRKPLAAKSDAVVAATPKFISDFVAANIAMVQHKEIERSWFFDPKDHDSAGNSKGYVQYGTFGFESNFVNINTKKTNYRRQVDDIEEVPLFYEFWWPDDSDFGLAGFQSFQGRSCISVVMGKLQAAFETKYKDYVLRYKKLMSSDNKGSLFHAAPVQRLTLIKKNMSSDKASRYIKNIEPPAVDFEVSVKARRKGALGSLAAVAKSLGTNAAGLVVHDGITFDEAVAEVRIGKKLRRVGVFGSDSDAGVIDLTDTVKRGLDGHPTYKSLSDESDEILSEFYETLSG